MKGYTNKVIAEGGEGAILRRVGSAYTNGRSTALLKSKVCSL